MKGHVLFLVFIAFVAKNNCASANPPPCYANYYWKDYNNGLIPEDAVEGGSDVNGQTFYVAQALFRYSSFNEPLVTTVYPGQLSVKGLGHGIVRVTTKNIKILCGPDKEDFQWRFVKSPGLHQITDAHVIIGGSEMDSVLHIGRVMHEGHLVVGKVYNDVSPYKGIWVPQGQGQVNYLSYEVLTFKCKKNIIVY